MRRSAEGDVSPVATKRKPKESAEMNGLWPRRLRQGRRLQARNLCFGKASGLCVRVSHIHVALKKANFLGGTNDESQERSMSLTKHHIWHDRGCRPQRRGHPAGGHGRDRRGQGLRQMQGCPRIPDQRHSGIAGKRKNTAAR